MSTRRSPVPVSPGDFERIEWDKYDFIDLGSSTGGSLQACAHYFGAEQGIGIDLDGEKVRASCESGFNVIHGDATTIEASNAVRFVSAIDFFEHLPSLSAVEEVLARAARAATDFIYISHPSFEAEHYLTSLNVTQYWHAWTGHPTHITISDYCRMFHRLGLHSYAIEYIEQIITSDHPSIIPLGLKNQGPYELDKHGPRPQCQFKEAVWRSQRIFVALRPSAPEDWRGIVTAWPTGGT